MNERPLRSEEFLRSAMALHGDAVFRLALCRMRCAADAEDVYQDVFLRLLRDRTAFTGDEHLKAWLLRVTLNRCASLWRSPFRRHAALDEIDSLCVPPPDPEGAALWEAVGRLPAPLRTAVHLHYAEGYGTEEIARLTGVRPATVRTRLHRARNQLRELLGDDLDEPLPGTDPAHEGA